MTYNTFTQKLRNQEKNKIDAVMDNQQNQVNRKSKEIRCYDKLREEYMDLTLLKYGEKRKPYFNSVNELVAAIEDLKTSLGK